MRFRIKQRSGGSRKDLGITGPVGAVSSPRSRSALSAPPASFSVSAPPASGFSRVSPNRRHRKLAPPQESLSFGKISPRAKVQAALAAEILLGKGEEQKVVLAQRAFRKWQTRLKARKAEVMRQQKDNQLQQMQQRLSTGKGSPLKVP